MQYFCQKQQILHMKFNCCLENQDDKINSLLTYEQKDLGGHQATSADGKQIRHEQHEPPLWKPGRGQNKH